MSDKVVHIYDWRRPRKPGERTLIFEIALATALCVWIVSLMVLALD
jgi:hypothetical protein